MSKLNLELLKPVFAVCKLSPSSPLPEWIGQSSFLNITLSENELSIVAEQTLVPDGVQSSTNWRALRVEGQLDFSLTGILSGLASPLAEAKISIFAISTFDTDYILVKSDTLERAVDILSKEGYLVNARNN